MRERIKRFFAAALSLVMTFALTEAAFAAPPPKRTTVTYSSSIDASADEPAEEYWTVKSSTGQTVRDTVYNILCMVTEAEVGSGFEKEAIKAQAVAAHSYLLYHISRGEIPSCPLKTPETRVKEAVAEVLDEVIYCDGKVIEAVYSRSSGGGTQSSADYWGGVCSYLQPVDSPYDIEYFTRTVTADYAAEWYPESTFPEDKNDWFEVVERNSTGFALKVRAGDQVLSGISFTSTKHLWMKSNKITDIAYDKATDSFTFTVAGYGHGVGLSQIGANGYAKYEGRDYEWILKHYYTGVTIYNLKTKTER